jgi:hypothetical protein
VVAVEVVGQALLGHPVRLLSLGPAAQSLSMLIVGAIAGALLGALQRAWVRDLPRAWPALSAAGLGGGLGAGAALANGTAGAITTPLGFALLVVTTGIALGVSTRGAVRVAG